MNEVAHRNRPAPIVQFKHELETVVSREMDMLDDKAKSRMKNAMMVAVTKDPEILNADRASVFMAARMCAAHGVVPDGVEATIQTYNTKVKVNGQDKWIKKATYLPMIRGIVNRVQRSGKIKLFYAECVYAGETFRIDTTHGDRRPVHDFDPMQRGADKDITGAYSVAVYHDDVVDVEPMPRSEIDKVRNVAKTKNVWDGWYSEKAKVAVMKRHAKRLPLSAEDMDFILNRDETDFNQARDVTPERDDRPNLAQRLTGAPEQSTQADDGPEEPDTPDEAETASDEPIEGEVVDGFTIKDLDPSEAFPGSDEFTEGVKAFQDGAHLADCPYQDDRQRATDWVGGFYQAAKAKNGTE